MCIVSMGRLPSHLLRLFRLASGGFVRSHLGCLGAARRRCHYCVGVLLVCLAAAWLAPARAAAGNFSLRAISASGPHQVLGPNEILLMGGDQIVRIELFLSDWGPDGLRAWQARIDPTTFSNGIGADLTPALLGCSSHSFCVMAYEPDSFCALSTCTAGFINQQRADWVFIGQESCGFGVVADVVLQPYPHGYLYFATTDSSCATEEDGTVPRYGGGLALYVPGDAAGVYEIGLREGDSVMAAPPVEPLPVTVTRLRIILACESAADCEDGSECTDDACGDDGLCQNMPVPEGTPCGSSSTAECDAPDSCDNAGVCLDRIKDEGVLCRKASGDCDLPAICDGSTPACPSVWRPDGTACPDDGDSCTTDERCIKGACLSFDDCECATPGVCGDGCCMPGGEDSFTCVEDCTDLRELSKFFPCFSGEGNATTDCLPFDLDGDERVTLFDFSLYLRRHLEGS